MCPTAETISRVKNPICIRLRAGLWDVQHNWIYRSAMYVAQKQNARSYIVVDYQVKRDILHHMIRDRGSMKTDDVECSIPFRNISRN